MAAVPNIGLPMRGVTIMTSLSRKIDGKNIDWMAENLRDHGYNMISNDGWIEAAQTINENGYITKYCSYWKNGFDYWNKYIKDKGMNVGVYYNPMWMTRAAFSPIQ